MNVTVKLIQINHAHPEFCTEAAARQVIQSLIGDKVFAGDGYKDSDTIAVTIREMKPEEISLDIGAFERMSGFNPYDFGRPYAIEWQGFYKIPGEGDVLHPQPRSFVAAMLYEQLVAQPKGKWAYGDGSLDRR